MRLYLDHCAIQDLKRDNDYQSLLNEILEDKKVNIYCFSEAHLYDLSRDKTDHKFEDMEFMEKIVDNNCWRFVDKPTFEHLTPFEYYDSFDWTPTQSMSDLFKDGDPFMSVMLSYFKTMPLNLNEFVNQDQLPPDMPEEFKELITKPTTFYEFMVAFLDFSDDLDKDKQKFKMFLRYLHQNSLVAGVYKAMGIEGYDGAKITDKQKLLKTYSDYFQKEEVKKNQYDLFIDMYYGLETFGFVKGKTSKQRMMNLINDARHAYFGSFSDIVVSSDDDFVKKTRFIYDLCDIRVPVVNIKDLSSTIKKMNEANKSNIIDLIKETHATNLDERFITVDETEDERAHFFRLTQTYFGYFDMLAIVDAQNGHYFNFMKEPANLSSGTLVKEIYNVNDRLIKELGPDVYDRTDFDSAEIIEGKWVGRTWSFEDNVFNLNFTNKLYLALYPSDYVHAARENENESQK